MDYDEAIQTPEGSEVGNHLLRELMDAMGESQHARPITSREVWDQMLDKVRSRFAGETWAERTTAQHPDIFCQGCLRIGSQCSCEQDRAWAL